MQSQMVNLETTRLSPHPEKEGDSVHNEAPAAPASVDSPASYLTREQMQDLQKRVIEVLMTCFDPEVPVNIYELGLIYNVEIAADASIKLRMTLTSPACPVAGTLPGEVQRKIQALEGVRAAKVELVWEPPWDKSRMSEAAKLQLGIED